MTPAGKATRRLSLLSGGEKALVALAFVFSVFLARPSPFYILDEVEAALDDANIDRFLQLVRRFSDRAQFIIVTHQKRTMDAADVLYGVSMGKGGVTKVVSRRFEQAAARAQERTRRRRPRRPEPRPSLASRSRGVGRADSQRCGRLLGSADRGRPSQAERGGGRFARLRERLAKSRQALSAEISASLFDRIDDETWERLEEALILADVGAQGDRRGRRPARDGGRGRVGLRPGGDPRAADRAARRARRRAARRSSTSARKPTVIMVVGVNGTGKTTTIGKLASVLRGALRARGDRRRRRHLPRRGDRAARDLGRARGDRDRQGQRRRRPRRGRLRRARRRRGARTPTSSSSTPPGACTRTAT